MTQVWTSHIEALSNLLRSI